MSFCFVKADITFMPLENFQDLSQEKHGIQYNE